MMRDRAIPYAVELDGTVTVHNKGELETIAELSQLKGGCRVLTDFQDAISRTATIDADPRYVELMISRKLQETGDFDEPVTVITHWKKKHGKNTCDIYYTAVPAKRYYHYLELVAEHHDHMVLLPLQSMLLAMLKKHSTDRPVATVIQHGRFADVLVGTRQKIWYANRVVAFDESQEQIHALWETVRTDIDTTGHDHHRPVEKIVVATWINSGSLPQWSDEGAPEVVMLDEQSMVLDGQHVTASLPEVLLKINAGQAIAPRKDKIFYAARRALPFLNAVILASAIGLAILGKWYQHQASGFEHQIHASRQLADSIRSKAPEQIKPVPYEKTLSFVRGLWSSRNLPTYGQILKDIGPGTQGVLQIENIKADYSEEKVAVKAFGSASAPFETSYKAYQLMRQRLSNRGYKVLDERFDTRINASSFVLQFAKEVQ